MNPEEYLQAIEMRLITDSSIVGYRTNRKQWTSVNGYIRARLTFVDGSELQFSEFFHVNESGAIEVTVYSYHWMNNNQLKMRWDNAPHYPNLVGFPHHLHLGDETTISPSEPMNLSMVLDFIGDLLSS